VAYEATGGEPTEQERIALAELLATTYPECRRLDSEILRRAAAMSNRAAGTSYSERPYGVLYREEVTEAIKAAKPEPELSAPTDIEKIDEPTTPDDEVPDA
jgi:hypothetical protein